MKKQAIILRQNKNLRKLLLSFSNNIVIVKRKLELGHSNFLVVQSQEFNDVMFIKERLVTSNSIHEIFGAQVEMLLDILQYLNDNIEVYERIEILESFLREFGTLSKLLATPNYTILVRHKVFMENELIPLINIHLDYIDKILKIKDYKSRVRKKLADKGVVEFSQPISNEIKQEILGFFELKCATLQDFNYLKNELSNKEALKQESYNIKKCKADEMILFFKIMKKRQIISEISNENLARWLFRKFKYLKNGEYVIGIAQRTIQDKLNSKLTPKEYSKKLDVSF